MSEEEETLSRHSTFNHKPSDMAGALRARRASWSKPGVELRLVLGVTAPYKIMDASDDLLDLFQLSAAQCIGRNVGVLSGPDTNTQTFGELMKAVGMGKRARAVLMLYSCSGAGERFCVSAQPYFAPSGELTNALLEMEPCKAPTLKMAAQDDGRAKAIVEASHPFRAVFCSPEFEALYGLAEPMVLGRTLNLIHGPTTDQRTWMQVLTAATQGTPGNVQLVTATSDCREVEVKIEVQPIVNAAGYISHLLITFLRLRPYRHSLPPHHDIEYGLHQCGRQNSSAWDMPSPATIPDSKLPGDGQLWAVPQLMSSSAIAAAPRSTWSGYKVEQMDMMSRQKGIISPAHDREPFAPPAHRRDAELPCVILPQTQQKLPDILENTRCWLSAREARRSHSQSWTAANVRTTNSFEYRLWVQALARRGELREELKLQSSARITSARSSSPQTFAALASSSPACMEADDRHGHATQPRATSAQHARHKSYSASQFRAEDPEHRPPRHATTAPRQPKPSPEHMMDETESERDLLQCQKRPTTVRLHTAESSP